MRYNKKLLFFFVVKIPVIHSGQPREENDTSVAKDSVQEKLSGLVGTVLFGIL